MFSTMITWLLICNEVDTLNYETHDRDVRIYKLRTYISIFKI